MPQVRNKDRLKKEVSSVDGALIVDWSSSGEGDVPEGYVEMGEVGDNSAILLHELISDNDAMEDYIWSRDYIDALGISPVSASLPAIIGRNGPFEAETVFDSQQPRLRRRNSASDRSHSKILSP